MLYGKGTKIGNLDNIIPWYYGMKEYFYSFTVYYFYQAAAIQQIRRKTSSVGLVFDFNITSVSVRFKI